MRKQEYIHVHGLLVELSHYLIEQGDMSAETLSEYRGLDTRPMSVHESKGDHHEAIMVLAPAIESSLEPATDDIPDLAVR